MGFSICEFLDKMWIFAPVWYVLVGLSPHQMWPQALLQTFMLVVANLVFNWNQYCNLSAETWKADETFSHKYLDWKDPLWWNPSVIH